jgi:superfamily II DNA or RNA helicase
MLRRVESVKGEGLRVERAPPGGRVFGTYRVKRKGSAPRPYGVLLSGNHGIEASCSCPDYGRSTLRFCKHIAAVLVHWSRQGKLKRQFLHAYGIRRPHLAWRPPLALTAPADPLLGLELRFPERQGTPSGRRTASLPKAISALFPVVDGRQRRLSDLPPRTDPAGRRRYLEGLMKGIKSAGAQLYTDTAVPALLEREMGKVRWPAVSPGYKPEFVRTLARLRQKLYPYQKEGVLRALAQGRFLLGDDMGLGKTTQAIAWSEALLDSGAARRILVICPNSLKAQWRQEWELVSGRAVSVVEGLPEDRQRLYRSRATVLIVNYELTWRDMDELLKLSPDAVILDEAQRIKNYASQTARQVKRLRPPFRLVLTGTPMENRVQEFVSLMDWVDEDAMGPLWRLDVDLSMEGSVAGAPRGVQGLGLVRQMAAPYFLRRRRDEVLAQLPPRTDTLLPVEVTDEQMAIHDDLGAKAVRLMKILEHRPLTPEEHLRLMSYLTRMRIVSNGLAQYDFEGIWPTLAADGRPATRVERLCSPKLGAFRTLIEGLLEDPTRKLVIFSQWQRMLRLSHWAVADLLRDAGAEAVFFTGAQDSRKRTEHIVRFHDDPRVRLFFATDAGGVGLNLQRAATVCINLELPWNPAVLEQRIGRIYRIGQELPIQVFNLVTERTIEERITALVGNKRAVFDALFDGTSDSVVFDEKGGFYRQVRHVMEDMGIGAEETEGDGAGEREDAAGQDGDDVIDLEVQKHAPEPRPSGSPTVDRAARAAGAAAPIAAAGRPAAVSQTAVAAAFRSIKVDRTPDGRVRVEAEGEGAKLLAEVFAGMAALFQGAAES